MRGQTREFGRIVLKFGALRGRPPLARLARLLRGDNLLCFSPPVMMATFLLEVGFAILVVFRSGSGLFRTIVITILLCLASFQLAEFQVCQGSAGLALMWTKFGVTGISFLPALGMHLISTVTRRSFLVPVGYALATITSIGLAFIPGVTERATCEGNYVILHISEGWVGTLWNAYYSIFLALAIMELALRLVARKRSATPEYSSELIALTLLCYLSFITPMAVVSLMNAAPPAARPSVMCGFALIMAFLLTLWVSPLHDKERAALVLLKADPVA